MNGLTLDEIRQIEMMNEQQQQQPQMQQPQMQQHQMQQPQMQQYSNVPQQVPMQQMQHPQQQYQQSSQVKMNIPEYSNQDEYIPPKKWMKKEISDPELLGSSKSKKKKLLKSKKIKKVEKTISQLFYDEIKEPLIVLILYLILSHPGIFNLFAGQLKYLRPRPDGQMHLIGFLIYGSILSSMFYLIKKFT